MQSLSNRSLLQRSRATFSSVVCRSCCGRRPVTTTAPPKPPTAGLAKLSSRRVLAVAGTDATKFLQGIVTQNVATVNTGRNNSTALPTPRTQGFYAGFLNATGRVMHDTFIYPFQSGAGGLAALDYSYGGDGFLIEADASQVAHLEKYIKRYKLRAKVSVRVLAPEEVSVWQAWDDVASNPGLPTGNSSIMTLRDPRAPAMGWRILQLGSGMPAIIDADRATEGAYTIRRYLQGVPEGQDELLREQALPLESNMEHMGGIDFHKGCYVGQELTIRTRHRGVVRKRVLPCVLYDPDRPAPTVLAYDPDTLSTNSGTTDAAAVPTETSIGRCGKRGRSAGKWLKGLGNVGLALCRLEIMTDAAAMVAGGGEQVPAAATYSPEDEFVVEWGGGDDLRGSVKIKAFVPDWLRTGMEGAQRKKQ